jgi:diguanylate cyclase (GGDEF)-like protein
VNPQVKASWLRLRECLRDFAFRKTPIEAGAAGHPSDPSSPQPVSAEGKLESQFGTSKQSYDALTGLPVTELFLQHVRSLMDTASKRGRLTGIIEIGLNDVKRVSDTFGPRFGDVLIRQAGFRLYSALKPGDSLSRVGAVNFAIALEPFESIEDALNVAQRFLAILDETFSLIELAEHPVRLLANAGLSIFPTYAESAEDLLYQASLALSNAGGPDSSRISVFSPERREESKTRLRLEWMMRRALEEHDFNLLYQPEIDLHSGRVIRREALLRWILRDGEAMPPSSFIPIAEATGLIIPLGRWALQEACGRARDWQNTGDAGVGVAVNVSVVQLSQSDFAETVRSVLREGDLPPELLELELTESALISGSDRSLREVSRLRQLGVSVVIDDFGVGYSSLTYLKELPVSGVKLDRSFLRDLQRNPNTLPILRSIVSLAHALKMRVTVEGVETEDELEEIRKLGVDAAQGFLLGRPESKPADRKAARTGA